MSAHADDERGQAFIVALSLAMFALSKAMPESSIKFMAWAYAQVMSGLFAGTPLEQPVTCERCAQPHARCACPRDAKSGRVLDPKDQPLRVRREQRRGKFVTVVVGFAARSERTNDLPEMLKTLKGRLGVGGTLLDTGPPPQGAGFELQGDHRDKLVEHFKSLGYPAKPSGG